MTQIGIISDVHGNLPALQAVLSDEPMQQMDMIVCAGDTVGILGWPAEVVETVNDVATDVVLGNHDARIRSDYAFGPDFERARQEMRVVSEDLDEEHVQWVQDLPERVETDEYILAHSWPINIEGRDTSFVGTVDNDLGVTPSHVTRLGTYLEGRTAIMGHTHTQFYQSVDKFAGQSGLLINPGSVGVPWNSPADYATYDTETGEVSLHSVEYDYSEVEDRFNEWGLHHNGLRTQNLGSMS